MPNQQKVFQTSGALFLSKEKLIFGFAVIWLVLGVLLAPVVETIMISSGFFVMGSVFPPWGWLLFSIILALPIVLLLERTGSVSSRFVVSLPFVFHSFPVLALMTQPLLYIMVFPIGIYALLCSPLNPLFVFPQTQWLLKEIVPNYDVYVPLFFLGICLFVLGFIVFTVAFIQFLRAKELITSGLYSIVRHPQYLGIIIATFGFTLFQSIMKFITLISWAILVFSYFGLARREEMGLQEKYGEEFLTYKRRVPFIIALPIKRKRKTDSRSTNQNKKL